MAKAKIVEKPKPILFKPTEEISALLDGMIDGLAVKNRTDALGKAVKEWIESKSVSTPPVTDAP